MSEKAEWEKIIRPTWGSRRQGFISLDLRPTPGLKAWLEKKAIELKTSRSEVVRAILEAARARDGQGGLPTGGVK